MGVFELYSRGAEPFERHINGIQQYHDGKRWWIMKHAESASLRLPDRYPPWR